MSNTHEVNIVRVGPILPHPNADKLEMTMVGGYQVVTGKGNFKEGDLAVYIQPDSVIPQTEPFKFIWQDHVGIDGKVPAKRRRITVKRLRKEYSEGLLMPIYDFPEFLVPLLDRPNSADLTEGMYSVIEGGDVASTLGIEHYVPEFDVEGTKSDTQSMPHRKYPRSLKGWFYFLLRKMGLRNAGGQSYALEVSFDFPVYNVNALKNARRETFGDGEAVSVTEKIHGSNGRFVFVPDDEKKPFDVTSSGVFYVGSHEQWKKEGPNVWWNVARHFPEIKLWCMEHPGLVLYGEVGPTQKKFRYGTQDGKTFFFAFDVYDPTNNEWHWPGNLGFAQTVPVLYVGGYDVEFIKKFVEGKSLVPGADHIREGIVISSRERRLKLKVVSNAFLEGDSK